MPELNIGLIINPLAGLGGSRGLKGSDGDTLRQLAATMTEEELHRSQDRAMRALAPLTDVPEVRFTTWSGAMGADVCAELGLTFAVLGGPGEGLSGAADTVAAARAICASGVDILLFAGGDGTARDIFDAVGQSLPVLGLPAGVKMHSGVFAVSPEAAGELLLELARGGLVGLRSQEVRDIDEEAFRRDVVRSRFYGDMLVPGEGRFLQHTKVGGRESQELVAAEIATWMAEQMDEDTCYLIGPGSTTAAIMDELGVANTLLGVDVVRNRQLLCADANESDLLEVLAANLGPARIVVTAIGGQGHIFGRGNQQLSPAVIRAVGADRISIVAAKSKITSLEGRPLLVDTNDTELDEELCGYHEVITGYDDRILYPVGRMPIEESR
ncbi:ATP-NAD kinase family protein [Pseudohalioglobus lutimaris]|uniref:ATP-NAD kinase n=1 Tax=Pseudohalioglobus lutimaris TaxID=1737061 RepID=A0A2N5X2U2_9GAMM|nr:ATP-NAD kinase family protein [Pseudohalioglobus lutimaris]PLW68811.1 ATP-NAD kinase [Pseudohalioglobus lutimaris]